MNRHRKLLCVLVTSAVLLYFLFGCSWFQLFYPEWIAPPHAIIVVGHDEIYLDERLTLDGTQSYDPNYGPESLKFEWTSDPTVTISGAHSQSALFNPLRPKAYTFTLCVDDGYNHEDPESGVSRPECMTATQNILVLEDWQRRTAPSGDWPDRGDLSVEQGEAFSANMDWCVSDFDDEEAHISDGYLTMKCSDELVLLWKEDASSSFELSAVFAVPTNIREQWFGICFRMQDQRNGLFFLARTKNNGEVALRSVRDGKETFQHNWSPCPMLVDGREYCELRVLSNGVNLEFYMDDQFLFSGIDEGLTDGEIGLVVINGVIQVENLLLR